jgi:hypothetical protein
MTESFRYIETLFNVSKTAFFTDDYDSLMDANQNYWWILKDLNYNLLYNESLTENSKEKLKAWESNEEGCKVSVKRLTDEAEELQKDIVYYVSLCKDEGRNLKEKGVWSSMQYEDCFNLVQSIEILWSKRLRELLDIYNIKLNVIIKDMPIRTSGRQKGKKSVKRHENQFSREDLKRDSINGVKFAFPIEHIYDSVSKCLYEQVLIDDLRRAFLQANPNAVSNGNRIDILFFAFDKFSDKYVATEKKESYKNIVRGEILKINPDFNFEKTRPHKSEQEEIWDFDKKDFRKKVKIARK